MKGNTQKVQLTDLLIILTLSYVLTFNFWSQYICFTEITKVGYTQSVGLVELNAM